MKVISFITQKGGSGKTTSLLNLATHASIVSKGMSLVIDLDPQKSTLAWWESREHENVGCIDVKVDQLSHALDIVEKKGFTNVFIDTPARAESVNNIAIKNSDFCLLPCQPSLLDMRAAKASVESIKTLGKKGAFFITRANPRGYRVEDAINALKVHGLPVCPIPIVDRTAYRDSYAYGEGVCEYEPNGKAAIEIAKVWNWTNKVMKKKMELAA
jgi:chromosome partitioning protein